MSSENRDRRAPHPGAWLAIALSLAIAGCSDPENTSPSAAGSPNRVDRDADADSRGSGGGKVAKNVAPATDPQGELAAARRLLAAGELEKAWQAVTGALVSNPSDPPTLFCAAQVRAAQQQYHEAAEILDAIPVEHSEAGVPARGQAADWLIKAGDFAAAEQRYLQILKHAPQLAMAHRRLAVLYNAQGLRQKAAVHTSQLVRLGDVTQRELCALMALDEPFHDASDFPVTAESNPLTRLSEARLLLVEQKPEEALRVVDEALQRIPDSVPLRAFQGRLLAELGDAPRLQQWHDQLPVQIETQSDYWYAMGSWLTLQNEPRDAVRMLLEAVERNPTDRAAHERIAENLTLLNEPQQLAEVRERILLLQRAYELGEQIGADGTDAEKMDELAGVLDQLQRPWQALAWRFVAAQHRGTLQQEAPELQRRREQLLAEQPEPSEEFLRIGMIEPEWQAAGLPGDLAPQGVADSPSPAPPLVLRNVAEEVGVRFHYDNGDDLEEDGIMIYQGFAGGIAAGDFDRDGTCDLYLTQAGGPPGDGAGSKPNALYRNLGGQFREVTTQSRTGDRGFGQGAAAGDFNQDGFLDLYVGNIGPNRILINNGDGTFTDATEQIGPVGEGWTTSVAIADLSGDGLPELVDIHYTDDPTAFTRICRNSKTIAMCQPLHFPGARDYWFLNRGDGTVEPWPDDAVLADKRATGLGLIITDIDRAGGLDLFVANDMRDNFLWLAENPGSQQASFAERAGLLGCATDPRGKQTACMGVAAADFDRNETLDFFVTNFINEAANFYLQSPSGLFSDAAKRYQLHYPTVRTLGFGAQPLDVDNDGWLELAALNGHIDDFRYNDIPFQMQPQLFRGRAGAFEEIDPETLPPFWQLPALGRALARLDWDRDGQMDLAAMHLDQPFAMLHNETEIQGNWVQLELVGTTSERDATGAWVELTAGGETWHATITAGDGFLCSNEKLVAFGLGDARRIESLTVRWPSGATATWINLDPNTRYLCVEGRSDLVPRRAS